MTYYSDSLKTMPYSNVVLKLNVYCSLPECNVLMRKGEAVRKIDGATYTHINCPTGAPKHTAAHRYPDTGLRFGT